MRENWLHQKLYPIRFLLLMCALLCVFVVNIGFPENIYGGISQFIYLPFLMVSSYIVFERKRSILYMIGFAAVVLGISKACNLFLARNLQTDVAFLYICFFGAVLIEVVRQIYRTPMVSSKIVMAAISGLLLIGYFGFYVFLVIELYQPGSFNNLTPGIQAVNDLFYFSFITILTVGYGDITPSSWIAKNATVLIALFAYIYSWVVIATIVGEVTSKRTSESPESGKS